MARAEELEPPVTGRTVVRLPDADPDDDPSLPTILGAGLLMGIADAVPGVSASTIALAIGIYERLIASISGLIDDTRHLLLPSRTTPSGTSAEPSRPNPRDPETRTRILHRLRLLTPLFLAIMIAYYHVTKVLVGPEDHPGWLITPDTAPCVYAFFTGLVLFSLPIPWRRRRCPAGRHLPYAAISFIATFTIVGLPFLTQTPHPAFFPFGGALAVSVMLLPGVSGSLMLLMVGQYTAMAGALHDLDIGVIALFGSGAITGLLLFVPIMRWLLEHRHDATLAVLTGMMAGSLRSLWPWKSNYDIAAGPLTNALPGSTLLEWVLILTSLAAGAAVVLLLSRLEARIAPTLTPDPTPGTEPTTRSDAEEDA